MKCHFGEFDPKVLQTLKEAYNQNANSFSESCDGTFDFKTCQRSDGTTYGVPDKSSCAMKGAREISSTPASLAAEGGAADPFSIENVMAKAGPELAKTAFGFGGLIKGIGDAAGVGAITDVVGGAVQQQEIRRTNQMLEDNAAKAKTEAAKSKVKSLETALKYAGSAEEKKMIEGMLAKAKMESGEVPPKVKALQTALVHASSPEEKAMLQGMIDKEMGIEKPKPKPAPQAAPAKAKSGGGESSMSDKEAANLMIQALSMDAEMRAQNECQYAPNPQGCLQIKRQQNAQGASMMGDLFHGSLDGDEARVRRAIDPMGLMQ